MARSEKTFESPVTLDVPGQQTTIWFKTFDDVERFIAEEAGFWTEVFRPLRGRDASFGHIIEAANSRTFALIDNFRKGTVNAGTAAAVQSNLNDLMAAGYLFSTSRFAAIVKKAATDTPAAVPGMILAFALALPTAPPTPPGTNRETRLSDVSLALAATARMIQKSDGDGDREVLDSLIREGRAAVALLKGEQAKWEPWFAEHQAHVQNEYTAFAEGRSERFLAVEKDRQNQERQLVAMRNDFEKNLQLEAPRKYWDDKARRHDRIAWRALAAFVGLGACAIWALFWFLIPRLQGLHAQITAEPAPGLVALYPIVIVTVPALAAAWLLRHVSRIVVQNFALAEDARLRGTIALTYLAITKGREQREAEAALLLQALFRPFESSSHVEIAPPTIDNVLNLVSGKK